MQVPRCGTCYGCVFKTIMGNCGICTHCKDMIKFGGKNIKKQQCKLRRCTVQRPYKRDRLMEKKCRFKCKKCEWCKFWTNTRSLFHIVT